MVSTRSLDNLRRLMLWSLALGVFVLVSGKVWIESGSARNSQVYIFLLLPTLVYMVGRLALRRKFRLAWPYIPWLLYLAWCAASVLWGSPGNDDPWSLAKRGLFIFIFIFSIHVFVSEDKDLFKKVLMVGVAVVALGALLSLIGQFWYFGNSLGYREFRIYKSGFREYADYGWPVVAGIFHGAIGVLALGFALDKRASKGVVVFWLLVFCILGIYVLFTYARGAWVGLAMASTLSIFMHRSRRGWYVWGFLVATALVAILIWRQELFFELTQRKLSGRLPIWEYFFSVMPGHWWLGHGLGSPFEFVWLNEEALSPHAHSLYLQQIYDSGLVSLLLLFAGVLGLLCDFSRFRGDQLYQLAIPALFFALVAMLTDVERIFTRPGDYWVVFWLPVAILLSVRSGNNDMKSGVKPTVSLKYVVLVLLAVLVSAVVFQNRSYFASKSEDIGPLLKIHDVYRYFHFSESVRNGVCHSVSFDKFERECIETKPKTLFLWGDSLAAALYPGLLEARNAHAPEYGIVQATDGNAPPFTKSKGLTIDGKDVVATNQQKLKLIAKLKPEVVLLHWYTFGANAVSDNAEALKGLLQVVSAIRKASPASRIVVLGPTPAWKKNLVDVVLEYWDKNFKILPEYSDYEMDARIAGLDKFLSASVPGTGAEYISVYNQLCKSGGCRIRLEGGVDNLLMVDKMHLTPKGSGYLISQVWKEIFQ